MFFVFFFFLFYFQKGQPGPISYLNFQIPLNLKKKWTKNEKAEEISTA